MADPAFGGWTVAFGRAVVAAIIAIAVLTAKGQSLCPPREELRPMVLVVGGVVVGFPLFTSLALETVDSAHGAVLTGLIPAATAGFAVLLAGERPHRSYWWALAIGLAGILSLPVMQGHGRPQPGDLLLLAAVAVAGLGYAQGGVLARKYGGWRIICWALVLALPVVVPVTTLSMILRPPQDVTIQSLVGLGYLSVISMCLAFFAWYEGLARGGIARVGRLQLAQPILTIGWSVLLLGEQIDAATCVVAAIVLGAVVVGRNARVDTNAPARTISVPTAGGHR
jgi:drug/metabolite transporter (DMT)-like permease